MNELFLVKCLKIATERRRALNNLLNYIWQICNFAVMVFSFSTTVARQSVQIRISWLIPTILYWKKQTQHSRHLFGFLLFNSKHALLVSCFCQVYFSSIENKWEMESSGPLHQEGNERGQFCFSNLVIFLASHESSSAKMCFSHMDCVHELYTNVCLLSVIEWVQKTLELSCFLLKLLLILQIAI